MMNSGCVSKQAWMARRAAFSKVGRTSVCQARRAIGTGEIPGRPVYTFDGAARRSRLVLLLSFSSLAFSQSLILPSSGCPMAHCDSYVSSQVNFALPTTGSVSMVSHDTAENLGSSIGLGCSSNGAGGVVACTLDQVIGPDLIVYNADGAIKWTSSLVGPLAYASAPIVDVYGDVVVADDRVIARFDPNGNLVWKVNTIGSGVPVSLGVVNGTTILTAKVNGPISLYSFANGSLLGSLTVTDSTGAVYDTVNTVCMNGNAAYVSLQNESNTSIGELAKILVNPGGSPALSVVWTFPFGGPSGSSPHYDPNTNTVFFDGASQPRGNSGPGTLFAVVDQGSSPQLLWSAALPAKLQAAVTQDPRGGIWAFAAGYQYLWRFSEATGAILQTIDVNALLGPVNGVTNGPSSAMTITPNSVMLLGTVAVVGKGPSYLVALNLNPNAGALVWEFLISSNAAGDKFFGQTPIVIDPAGNTNIAFTTRLSGAYFLTP